MELRELPDSTEFNMLQQLRENRQAEITEKVGGPGEDRTPDPLVANQVLSQLSYRPIGKTKSDDRKSQAGKNNPCGMQTRTGRSGLSNAREDCINSEGEYPNRQGLICGKLIHRRSGFNDDFCRAGPTRLAVTMQAHHASD